MGRQTRDRSKKKSPVWQILSLILAFAFLEPEVWEVLGILIAIAVILSPVIIPLIIYFRRKKHRANHQRALEDTTYSPCRQEKALREERKQFCFHKDKAIHHVGRGKEIDPWDRPDIDISKYQRKE